MCDFNGKQLDALLSSSPTRFLLLEFVDGEKIGCCAVSFSK
jgi:hypothetical protein